MIIRQQTLNGKGMSSKEDDIDCFWSILVKKDSTGNSQSIERINHGFEGTELLGLLDLIKDDILSQMKLNK